MYINDEDWELICDAAARLNKLKDEFDANITLMCDDMKADTFSSEAHNKRKSRLIGLMLATTFTLNTSIKYAKTKPEEI